MFQFARLGALFGRG